MTTGITTTAIMTMRMSPFPSPTPVLSTEYRPMAARRAHRDRDDLIRVFMEQRNRLIAQATRIIGCQCLAEDVVQDVMLKICEGGIEEEVKTPAAYLFRMVRNLAIDCSRRRAREMGLGAAEEVGGELVAQCPCPEDTMARCQALRIVAAALQELPERTRHAFEKHRIDGVSQRDIASELDVSPTLVNFMVRDAHNHCRAKLIGGAVDGDLVPAPAGRQPPAETAVASSRERRRSGKTRVKAAAAPEAAELADQDRGRSQGGKPGGDQDAGENAVKAPKGRQQKQPRNKEIALRGKQQDAGQQGLSGRL
jgi:RNA polymerase sigma-70 factor (ECF subfamily)